MSAAGVPPTLGYAKEPRRGIPGLNRQNLPLVATVFVCALLYGGASLHFDGFASTRVFANFIADNAVLGLTAIGLTFVILSGGIDLSVGAVAACASILIATLVRGTDWIPALHPAAAIVIILVLGVLFGLAQGALIRFFDLPAFLVTLAGLFFCRGMGLLISRESLGINHAFYDALSGVSIPLGGRVVLPLPGIAFLAVLAIAIYLARSTSFGRNCYALGGSEQSAALMGLPVGRTKLAVYAVSGFCSALAGVVHTVYTSSGNATSNAGLELSAIAAVVIGGTLLTGGAGSMIGTFFGVLIFAIIRTSIDFHGALNSAWTRITIAVLLLVFILLQKLLQRKGT
jgi:galactofuranose transport system permease protein